MPFHALIGTPAALKAVVVDKYTLCNSRMLKAAFSSVIIRCIVLRSLLDRGGPQRQCTLAVAMREGVAFQLLPDTVCVLVETAISRRLVCCLLIPFFTIR